MCLGWEKIQGRLMGGMWHAVEGIGVGLGVIDE